MLPLEVVLQIADGNDADYVTYRHRGNPQWIVGADFQRLRWLARGGNQTTYLHPLRCTNNTNSTQVKTGNGKIYKHCAKMLGTPGIIEGFEIRSDCEEACSRNFNCVGFTAAAPNSTNCSLLGTPNLADHGVSHLWRSSWLLVANTQRVSRRAARRANTEAGRPAKQ
jgi:hypothetical protein